MQLIRFKIVTYLMPEVGIEPTRGVFPRGAAVLPVERRNRVSAEREDQLDGFARVKRSPIVGEGNRKSGASVLRRLSVPLLKERIALRSRRARTHRTHAHRDDDGYPSCAAERRACICEIRW
jgi:hypothetical protein